MLLQLQRCARLEHLLTVADGATGQRAKSRLVPTIGRVHHAASAERLRLVHELLALLQMRILRALVLANASQLVER